MIDLAGSERLNESKVEGHEKKEAISINKSLSSLTDVISSMANKESHIPFRNSKLTFLLQDSLKSESAKVLMIVNVSPLIGSMQETINSLRFASKVNSCVLNKNVDKK